MSLKTEEIDCLFYEIVSKRFLDRLDVPSPELALVLISANSYAEETLNRHKRFCKPSQIYLGSKEIKGAEDLHGISSVVKKGAFNQILNPYDLVRIALFDLWIDNCDRGKNENYNLLIAQQDLGRKFYAFDHAFCFGGLERLRMFNELHPVSSNNKLIASTYFKKILPYLNKRTSKEIVDNFLSLQAHEIEQIISESYDDCPKAWAIPAQLKERMILFLTNANRIGIIKNLMWSLFK
ncbi:hypothetical protein EZ444_24000 [Pedobacter hiemivivus]|uniref:HipA-like kinase domain-containing protein n=1 Tax=Pedobacter hiemivivus TaxID=2530454 RepID=A0A4R0MIG8_9SPHI|nr:hypothetical protein EZ444_24000 [Pedobacter hiemivivus]